MIDEKELIEDLREEYLTVPDVNKNRDMYYQKDGINYGLSIAELLIEKQPTINVTDANIGKLTREECSKALSDIKMLGGIYIPLEALDIVEQLIDEHFKLSLSRENPPLKFEDLKEGMWIWDNRFKEYMYIEKWDDWHEGYLIKLINDVHGQLMYEDRFEEDRFYRYEVKGND